MRHVGGVVIGIVGAVAGLVVLAVGFNMATRALVRFQQEDLFIAVPVLVAGGALLGGLLFAGRSSRAAPLTAGWLMLVIGLVSAVDPLAFRGLGVAGAVALTSQQMIVTYAAILLVGAFAVRPSGGRAVGAGYSPTPYGVGGPYAPYAPGPPYPPGAPYPPGPPGPYPSAGPGMYPAGPGPYAGGPATPPGGPGSHPGEASPHPGAPERGSAAE